MKRLYHQSLSSGMGPSTSAPQTLPPLPQSKPSFVPPPPVPVPVPSLDSSQLMTSGFDPLPHFMNPHLTQANTEPSATITPAGASVASGLLNANAPSQMPTETHPFLNQHPVVPSPGMCTKAAICNPGLWKSTVHSRHLIMGWLMHILPEIINVVITDPYCTPLKH